MTRTILNISVATKVANNGSIHGKLMKDQTRNAKLELHEAGVELEVAIYIIILYLVHLFMQILSIKYICAQFINTLILYELHAFLCG